jgi:exonuclease III
LFNAIINSHDLREIDMSGGQYTWSNNQINPTLEKLDRFLMSSDWEDLFPLTTIHKIAREVSDHNPIILDTMENREMKKGLSDLKKSR